MNASLKPCRSSETCAENRTARTLIFMALAVITVVAKALLGTQGNNYDMESYSLVADATLGGKRVYAETFRYNYGPVWAYVVAAARYAQTHLFCDSGLGLLHMILATILAYVDVLIALFLAVRFSFAAGIIFLLNPVSLLLTGLHTQFDNLAVLLGLIGAWLISDADDNRDCRRCIAGSLLLGLSLVVKHVLIFYPAWLFLRPNLRWRRKILICGIPYAVFCMSFIPYAWDPASLEGIIKNVFCYSVQGFAGFYPKLLGLIVPIPFIEKYLSWVPVFPGFKFLMLVSILMTGYALRRASWQECFMLYLVSICVFSSQLADQYFAIPLVACAFYRRSWLTWSYMILTTGFLLASPDYVAWLPWMHPVSSFFGSFLFARWQPVTFIFLFLLLAIIGEWRRARKPAAEGSTQAQT